MHDELVDLLRRLSDWSIMDYEDNLSYANQIAEEAADAIENLTRIVSDLSWDETCDPEYRQTHRGGG